jgi:hypothetical protein
MDFQEVVMNSSDELANQLSTLIQYLHEIINGYSQCEKRAHNPDIKYIFYEFKLDRINMQRQLARLLSNEEQASGVSDEVNFLIRIDGEDKPLSDEQLINEICLCDRLLMNKYAETLQNIPPMPQIMDALKEHIQEIQNNLQFITTCKAEADAGFYH